MSNYTNFVSSATFTCRYELTIFCDTMLHQSASSCLYLDMH